MVATERPTRTTAGKLPAKFTETDSSETETEDDNNITEDDNNTDIIITNQNNNTTELIKYDTEGNRLNEFVDFDEYIDFKKLINTEIMKLKAVIYSKESDTDEVLLQNKMINLKNENEKLKSDLLKQEKLIDYLICNASQSLKSEDWKVVKYNSNHYRSDQKNINLDTNISLSNTFNPIYIEHENIDVNYENELIHATISKPHHDKIINKRPNICTTEKYLEHQNQNIVPGDRTYAETTKNGKKVFLIGDSHVKRIKRNLFNKSLISGKSYIKTFSGSNTKQLNHYILPTLVDESPDIVIIHIGSNDITDRINTDPNKLAEGIINIGKKCKQFGVKEVVISSILVKSTISLTNIIRQLNRLLNEMCILNGFHYICNDNITPDFLWRDGIHLKDNGTNILAGNMVDYLNSALLCSSYINNNV